MNFWKAESILPLFFFLGIICHGIFFVREWIVLGSIFIFLCLINWRQFSLSNMPSCPWSNLFFGAMILLSLAGLIWPVRSSDGWLDALRWLIYWIAYLWGSRLAEIENKGHIVLRLVGVTLICIILSLLPGSEKVWLPPPAPEQERYAFCFGYPNTAADFLFCHIMVLYQYRKKITVRIAALMPAVWGLFICSLLLTGSRMSLLLSVGVTMIIIFKDGCVRNHVKHRGHRRPNQDGRNPQRKKEVYALTGAACVVLLLFIAPMISRYPDGILHLFDWTNTSLTERMHYFRDSIKLAWDAHFLPRAGGWLAFSFVQTTAYWTLDPHSSFCRILLNQGLAGVAICIIWAGKGVFNYVRSLIIEKNMDPIISKTAVLYLGLHSAFDADMLFGIVGILFWMLAGMNRTA
ncbi:hypothetical protein LPY66_20260 [Dehalobacter sp. DCM]|uniref:O-antigen ligase family protein n=1 Tax=Dehalobacter sp. DCM TaxID=2907827 RepID=UPI0030818696|nr:hypothetical protein LPY66_20260 [Dehalobacter sp. DCM]